MRIAVGSDHAAVDLRGQIARHLAARGVDVVEIGPEAGTSSDYPDQAAAVAHLVIEGGAERGVLVCGTGIGMSIAANKVPGIRAALVHDTQTARLAAEHNKANILCLGARVLAPAVVLDSIDAWLDTTFEERHQRRLDKITALEAQVRAHGGATPSGGA